MLKNLSIVKTAVIAFFIICSNNIASAFGADYYAKNSKLATGKWVKIKVTETGIQEITYEELSRFGFSDPSKVKVFGHGGEILSEILYNSMPDDIEQIPVLNENNKILFYGKNGRKIEPNNTSTNEYQFIPTPNPYSDFGYYFLSDIDVPEMTIKNVSNSNTGTTIIDNGKDYAYHELELKNIGSTGRIFFGEDFASSRSLSLEMSTPGIVAGEPITFASNIAYSGAQMAYINVNFNGKPLTFEQNNNLIRVYGSTYEYYNSGSPSTTFTPTASSEKANIVINLETGGTVKLATLNYVTLTYKRLNSLQGANQCRLFFNNINEQNKIVFYDTNSNTHVWNLENTQKPYQYQLESTESAEPSKFNSSFTPGATTNWLPVILFNSAEAQHKVELVGEIANQNLHAEEVPDMLIISPKAFIPYAQQVADLHKKHDNMDVAVIDQDLIFNEFSGGTPDATAYRRIAKMFWDKDPKKFKYLLLFGRGSYDNRDVLNSRSKDRLLTYQSYSSNHKTETYVTDDYYGFLKDNSGGIIIAEKVCIGIGRLPVTNVDEAQVAANKIRDHIENSKFDSWNNNGLIIADEKENNLFNYQSESIEKLVNDTIGINLKFNKVYVDEFLKSATDVAVDAKNKTKQFLTDGQVFATYSGHGGPEFLTKVAKMWTHEDVKSTDYDNLPLFTLATCDVASFDADAKGIAELMFHEPNGGAVAVFASARTVYAGENDMLNRAFIRGLFTLNEDGSYPTIGEANMKSKLSFEKANLNKLNYNLLGDPAMKICYPKPNIEIININGTAPEEASIKPLSPITITGEVKDKLGKLRADFNGSIKITIYDKRHKFGDLSISVNLPTYTAYICNDILAELSGKVINGKFTIEGIVPKYSIANNEISYVSSVATKEGTNELVSGLFKNLTMMPFDETSAIVDDLAPEINAMYLNDTSFRDGDEVEGTPTLFVNVADDNALNFMTTSIGNSCTVLLDGKTTYLNLFSKFDIKDNAKTATLQLDLKGLTTGKHTIEFWISDIANNRSSKAITFFYNGQTTVYDVEVAEYPASDKATFEFKGSEDTSFNNATITVLDNNGKTIWKNTVTSLPYVWNLVGSDNQRVAPGAYSYYVSFSGETQVGATDYKKIIVVKQ